MKHSKLPRTDAANDAHWGQFDAHAAALLPRAARRVEDQLDDDLAAA